MHFDLLQIGAACTALLSILGVWGFIVYPFKKAMEANEFAMAQLKDSIKELAYELKTLIVTVRLRKNYRSPRRAFRSRRRRSYYQQRTYYYAI